jgi:acyl-homoserine-lactone acylase
MSRRFTGRLLVLLVVIGSFTAQPATETTVYRDTYGVPHVFAPTIEDAAYAMGYLQAEDRLEELLKNYRRAAGTMAEVFGPDHYGDDVMQRRWRHREIARERYQEISPRMRGIIEAFVAGVHAYMKEHPAEVPAWAPMIEPWDIVALGRYIIFGWPLGEAYADLDRAGIEIKPAAYRGSNEMLITASRTALGAPIAVVDPHLSWYGPFRFYQVRVYAGDFAASGVSIVGLPFPSLGHSRYLSIAMTTGGPDTSDVFEETLNPANPRQYRYNGAWRDVTMRRERIGVKDRGVVRWREVAFESTHHGPIVERRKRVAYAMAIPYANEVTLLDQGYEMMTARNLDQAKRALGRLQLMAQNVMIGTVGGDIYYVRNGRVPIRAAGVDSSRPIPGDTVATEWQGVHRFDELVQITNPAAGWMQNCNVAPFAMMKSVAGTPLAAETYAKFPYLYNPGRNPAHQRAFMMNELLDRADKVTLEQIRDITFNPEVWGADKWQARVKSICGPGLKAGLTIDVCDLIINWNRRSDADSQGALAFYAFKRSLPRETARRPEPPDTLTDAVINKALTDGAAWMKVTFGSLQVPYGRYFRVGREGSNRSWPIGGGNPRDVAMATPRSLTFKENGKQMIAVGGQTATQIVVLTNPPESYSISPLGHSDRRDSGHWEDQAEKLVSKSQAAPSYFLRKDELLKHVTRTQIIRRLPSRAPTAD